MLKTHQSIRSKSIWMVLLVTFAILANGCANPSPSTVSVATNSTEPATAEDKDSLIVALQAAGASVEMGEPVSQDFFTPEGSILKVNNADVQVFEYDNAEAMESEASQVAPDGGSIGTSMVNWVDSPHFYKAGKIIVLYIGSDEKVLDWLENALGPQFAGR